MLSKFLKILSVTLAIIASFSWSVTVLMAESWEAPTDNPPGANRFRPINISDLIQEKTGALILSDTTKGLIMRDQSALVFGDPLGSVVGFKASTTAPTSDIVWTLPITDGDNGWVLKTDGNGNLSWTNPFATMNLDSDWSYVPDSTNPTSIYSTTFTRIGSGGTINLTTPAAGDLYVQNRLEVDGGINISGLPAGALLFGGSGGGLDWNSSGDEQLIWNNTDKQLQIKTNIAGKNAELDFQSGNANTHWGIYQENSNGDLRFWNTDNRVTFTDTGRVGLGTTAPAQTLDVAGGLKLTGLLYDSGNSAGNSGQLLSRNDSNIQWIDPTWWTGSGFIYSMQNTRVGASGTIDYANGVGDLYVQNKLEVDGPAYLKGITANNIEPEADNTYNLGSATKRWGNIFANSLSLNNFTTGSVIFQGASSLDQDNSKFFWDNANNRLGLGISTPSQTLEVKGNFNFTDTSYDGSSGAIMFGGRRFVSSLGKSFWTSVWTGQEEYSNTYLGTMSGSVPVDQDVITDNTAVGFYALNNNIYGAYNTALGSNAMYYNSEGYNNTSIGFQALYSNTIGSYLTAIGAGALYSPSTTSYLTAVGYSAGYSNSSGTKNVFLGDLAGYSNSSGSKNVYLGSEAGNTNQQGSENVLVGYRAGLNNSNSTGSNTMIGSDAGVYNYSGSGNIFIGRKAGFNETGNYKLYIDSTEASATPSDGNNALIYGQFYSNAAPDSYLRFNGKVGITPRGTTNVTFNSNSLLHLYKISGSNAEFDIQSVSGSGNHWGIYQDRTDADLKFWQNSNRVIFADTGQVAIGGNIDLSFLLKVYGNTYMSTSTAGDYRSSDNNQKGNTAYICVNNGTNSYINLRFDDGLYICSTTPRAACNGADTCTNP